MLTARADTPRKNADMYLPFESSVVTSPCPLLPPESAEEFLPSACMTVPKNSAWVAMQVNVVDYASPSGEIDEAALTSALRRCVDEGDREHDEADWREPLVEYDSWLNRRLAIALRGWGDLVAMRGEDPGDIATLRRLEELARWMIEILCSRSRALANGSNWCPALDEAGARVVSKSAGPGWRFRWRRAILDVAVRHRNLTTMSPWDVFPRQNPADLRYADLLPLLRFADSLSFQRDVSISRWNANDFKGFHERVGAILRCNNGAGLVAKQV